MASKTDTEHNKVRMQHLRSCGLGRFHEGVELVL